MTLSKLKSLTGIESARSAWEKIITTTPVLLTVIATILAGLSSSEMSLAQYHRSLSAQNQSKAADQWAFFQAKRTRQEEADNTRSLLAVIAGSAIAGADAAPRLEKIVNGIWGASATKPADSSGLASAVHATIDRDSHQDARYLADGLPKVEDQPLGDPIVISAMERIAANQDASALVKSLSQKQIDNALALAQNNADNFDSASKPVTSYIDRLCGLADAVAGWPGSDGAQAKRLAGDLTVSRLSWNSRRNAAEAKYNQTIAQVLEVQVLRSSIESDRHHDRSKFFFYGMLAAQAGVTISTLSLAVKKRSILWALASLAGMGAVAYAAYIYLYT